MRRVVAVAYYQRTITLADLLGDDPRILPTVDELQAEELDEVKRATRR